MPDKRLAAPLDRSALLDYEIRSSWWARHIYSDLGQDLAARYFAWKVRRKFRRYESSLAESARLRTAIDRTKP